MRAVAPEVKTVEQPVQLLDAEDNRYVRVIGGCFETLGFQALEPKTEAVAFPIQYLDPVAGFVEKDEKHRIEDRHFYIQFDQCRETVDGFSEVDWLGVEIHFFDFGVGTHHGEWAPERNREHSIRDHVAGLNVGVMERLRCVHRSLTLQAPFITLVDR